MRAGLVALLLAMASTSVAASLVEETSGGIITYQFDAESHHDAPDACQEVGSDWLIPPDNRTDGMLVVGDDEADHYMLNLTLDDLGKRFTMRLEEASTPLGDIEADLDVLAPTCNGSVLDPLNQPPVPPQPESGQKQIDAQNAPDGAACAQRWFFILTGVDASTAPASIHVIWTDGHQEDVPMDSVPPEPVGQYQTTTRLDTTLKSVTANVPEGWDGNFRIGERSCAAKDGGATFGQPAVRMGDSISFTVLRPGPYVVSVHLGDVEVRDPTQPVPMTCHFCPLVEEVAEPAAEAVSYFLAGDQDDGGSQDEAS